MPEASETRIQATEPIEKELLMKEMMLQVVKLQKKFQSEGEDDERRWMIAHTGDAAIIAFLKESTVIMLHLIDAIGRLEPVNGITISKQFGIPRGSVSKITRKLADLRIVQSEVLPDNKKEVLFRLTSMGREIYDLHTGLHRQIAHNVQLFLRKYDVEQMRFLLQCMRDTAETSWVDPQAQPETIEGRPSTDKDGHAVPPASVQDEAAQDGKTIREIVAMLQRLDTRKLKKAKDLLQIAFMD